MHLSKNFYLQLCIGSELSDCQCLPVSPGSTIQTVHYNVWPHGLQPVYTGRMLFRNWGQYIKSKYMLIICCPRLHRHGLLSLLVLKLQSLCHEMNYKYVQYVIRHKPLGVENRYSRGHISTAMAVQALPPCVARSTTTTVLTMYGIDYVHYSAPCLPREMVSTNLFTPLMRNCLK